MHTVVEMVAFTRQAKKLQILDEELDFIKLFVGLNPAAGKVVRGRVALAKSDSRFEAEARVAALESLHSIAGPTCQFFLLTYTASGKEKT